MLAKPWSNVIMPNMSWKYTADSPIVAVARAMPAAIGVAGSAAPGRRRLIRDDHNRRGAGLLVLADHHRA